MRKMKVTIPSLDMNQVNEFKHQILSAIESFEEHTGFSPRLFSDTRDECGGIKDMDLQFEPLKDKAFTSTTLLGERDRQYKIRILKCIKDAHLYAGGSLKTPAEDIYSDLLYEINIETNNQNEVMDRWRVPEDQLLRKWLSLEARNEPR